VNLVDPGGRVVDYLRSCYSTMMVLSQDGHQSRVDWYFAQAGAPLLDRHNRMSSLNYIRPTTPLGTVGEVYGAPRLWRDGSYPDYIGDPSSSFSTAGTANDWLNGVNGNYGPIDLSYLGRKGFPYVPRAGVFPPLTPPTGAPTLLTPGGVPAPGTWNGSAWHFSSFAGTPPHAVDVYWGNPSSPWIEIGRLFPCRPDVAVLFAHDIFNGAVLKCTGLAGGVSTWTDPSGVVYPPTVTLTLTA